jgi:hypothetical protein
MMLQSWWYRKSSQMDVFEVTRSSLTTLHQAKERAAVTPWVSRLQDVFFTNILAPTPTMLDQGTVLERKTRRTFSLVDEEWFVLDFRHAVWAGWMILMLLGLTGLPNAPEHAGVATGALLLGWQVLFYGALEDPGERLLQSAAWTPCRRRHHGGRGGACVGQVHDPRCAGGRVAAGFYRRPKHAKLPFHPRDRRAASHFGVDVGRNETPAWREALFVKA